MRFRPVGPALLAVLAESSRLLYSRSLISISCLRKRGGAVRGRTVVVVDGSSIGSEELRLFKELLLAERRCGAAELDDEGIDGYSPPNNALLRLLLLLLWEEKDLAIDALVFAGPPAFGCFLAGILAAVVLLALVSRTDDVLVNSDVLEPELELLLVPPGRYEPVEADGGFEGVR